MTMIPNTIYEGDNKDILPNFTEKSIDLIYLDPPFFSNKKYEIIWNDGAEIRAFEDRWKGGIFNYIEWMKPSLLECKRILKDTGSIYLHCDYHANSHLRILMDEIFGDKNFKNEITWQRTNAHNDTNQYGHNSDRILFYTKSDKYTFNKFYTEYQQGYLEASYGNKDKGGQYKSDDLTGAGINKNDKEWKGYNPSKRGRHWAIPRFAVEDSIVKGKAENLDTIEKLDLLYKNGLIYLTKNGTPRFKRYLQKDKGVSLQEVWTDISGISSQASERLGYPTQKPIALLERIIKVSSNKNDLVLDPFCGCGTTIAASHKLERNWIGIDVSPTACKLMQNRMRKLYNVSTQIMRGKEDISYLKKLPPFEFQNWVCSGYFLGRVSDKKSSDMGIDGYTSIQEGNLPIQVKQSEGVGRNVVDNFETAIRRISKKGGYIVAFSFGSGAYEEVARARAKDGIDIKLKTVKELLDERK